jgi:hypothetical protein
MAVIVVIALVAIVLIYLGGNLRTLHLLSSDLKQIEQKQLRRLAAATPASNAGVITNLAWSTNLATLPARVRTP